MALDCCLAATVNHVHNRNCIREPVNYLEEEEVEE